MNLFDKAKKIKNKVIKKQIDLATFFLTNQKGYLSAFTHNPLCYPCFYADRIHDLEYINEFSINTKIKKRAIIFFKALSLYFVSEIRFSIRLFELFCLPLVSIFVPHKNNKNNHLKKIYTVYLTNNQNSIEDIIKYFIPSSKLKKNEQVYIEVFDNNSLIKSYLKSRDACLNKQVVSIFSSNKLILSLTGIFLLIFQNIYIKLLALKIIKNNPNLFILFLGSNAKLWGPTHLLSILSRFNFLHNLNYFANNDSTFQLWMEGHFNNWASIKSLTKKRNIYLFWPNSPSKTTYTNLRIFNLRKRLLLENREIKDINNIYLRNSIQPASIKNTNKSDLKKMFTMKSLFLATGHSFGEITDAQILFNYFKEKKINIFIKIHPHFLKNNYSQIEKNFPDLLANHNLYTTKSCIDKSSIIITTLDSIACPAISKGKIVIPIISTKYITYMNILEFKPLVLFINQFNSISIKKY